MNKMPTYGKLNVEQGKIRSLGKNAKVALAKGATHIWDSHNGQWVLI